MLLSRNHHRDEFIALSPSHDVHHRFRFSPTQRHGFVKTVEEHLVALLTLRDDDEGRNHEVVNHGYLLFIVQRDDVGKIARKALPVGLQWQDAARTCLEMKMIRGRSTALRTVVEHHQFAVQREEAMHLAIVLIDGLILMLAGRNGEMHRKDWERIHQQMEVFVYLLRHLLLWSVAVAEEARALAQGLPVYLGSRAHDAGRVPLQLD